MTDRFRSVSLTESLAKITSKQERAHFLQYYHTSLYNYITAEGFDVKEIPLLLKELDAFVEFLHDDRNKDLLEILTQPIRISIAKNYVALLTLSKSQLSEITNNFVSTFNESSKKINQNLKGLIIVVLSFIYESFGRDVSSFIPLIITLVLKYLKKDNINSLNLARLLTAVIRNGGDLEINESITSRYLKLIKSVTQVEVQSELINSLGIVAGVKKIDLLAYKTMFVPTFALGLSSKSQRFRINTAKALSESLVSIKYGLKEVFEVYVEVYIETTDPRQQIGVIESIINFISLKYADDFEFLNNNFEDVVNHLSSIFKHERILHFGENSKNRLFEHLRVLFVTMLKLTDESNQRSLLDVFFKRIENSNLSVNNTVLILQIVLEIFHNLTSLTNNEVEVYHIILWRLSTSSANEEVQNFAIQVLKKFAFKFPNVLKEVLETSLNELINFSKQHSSNKVQNKTLGFSLVLANLIPLADKDNIPEKLIKDIWEYNINYIKANNVLTPANFHNLTTSWIAISGVFAYNDDSFINSIIDEFMTVWENLKSDEKNGKQELILIEHSLVALLSFLNNLPEIKRSIANFFIDSLITRQPMLGVLKKQNEAFRPYIQAIENRALQIFLKLVDFLKNEKSSILIQTVHNFSNCSNFKTSANNSKTQKKTQCEELFSMDENCDALKGMTSKFLGYKIDELYLKFGELVYPQMVDYSIDISSVKPQGSIGLSKLKSWLDDSTWIEHLETSLLVNPISSAFKNDYFQPIFKVEYSMYRRYAPPTETSIVDSSVEIFSKSFSSLSSKVQLSLLETLRTHLLSKDKSELAKLVSSINVSIVLNGALTVADKEAHKFDRDVGTLILETLRTIYKTHCEDKTISKYLLVLNSESIGLLISMTSLSEQIPIFIKRIVDEEDSESRCFNSLVLSYVYQFDSSSQFNKISEILLKLAVDPHPCVHFWAMDSLATVIDKHLVINTQKAVEILNILRNCYLDDEFGLFGSGNLAGLNLEFDSNVIIAKVLRALVNSLGPTVKDLDHQHKEILEMLLWGLLFNFNDAKISSEVLKLLQTIVVFDSSFVKHEKITTILKFVICNNVLTKHIGSSLSLAIFEERNELFSLTTSDKLLNVALDFLLQLVKTTEDKSFLKEFENLIWICLELFPDSKTLESLVVEWLDTTYGISWFTKLQRLFFSSKYVIFADVLKGYRTVLDKFKHKRVEVDVKDEEAQSIAQREDADGSKSIDKNQHDFLLKTEPTSHQFQILILKSLRQLLNYTLTDSKLYQQLADKVPDLIKISYESSTSSVLELRLVGIELLGDIIQIYSSAKDPIYPEMSLLEQQQAQITSALVPSFQDGSTALLASQAIKVVAMFVGSKIIPVLKLNRVGKILTSSLEDLQIPDDENHGNRELKINEVVITSESGQQRVKLSILNSWAELKILANKYHADDKQDNELNELVEGHLDLLLPLWISSLKEFALLRHGSGKTSSTDVELFNDCWINFVDVIGLITRENPDHISKILTTNETGFFFMIYAHCIYSLSSDNSSYIDKVPVLEGLLKTLSFKELSEIIFHDDDVYQESIEVFERLMVTGTMEVRLILVDVVDLLFSNAHAIESFDIRADKLFGIMRVNFQPILQLIPITEGEHGELKNLSIQELQLLRKSFNSIIKMISQFPNIIRVDLYSTLLTILHTIFTRFDDLVPHVLPVLKEVLSQLDEMNSSEVTNKFYQMMIKDVRGMSNVNGLLVSSVFLTSSNTIKLNLQDVESFTTRLIDSFSNPQLANIATKTIKNLISRPTFQNELILKKLIPKLVTNSIVSEDPRIYIEIVILIMKQSTLRDEPLMAIIIPTLLEISQKDSELDIPEYVHKRLLMLISSFPEVFKKVVTETLDEDQRNATKSLVEKSSKNLTESEKLSDVRIKLKSFE